MEETAGGIFAANAHLGARISCYLVLFTSRILTKFVLLPFATLPVLVSFSSTLQRDRKGVSNPMLFPGNSDPLSLTPRGPVVQFCVVPLVYGVMRRDNLLAWRELFTNLYELKSRI
jgi:hypothetical protein